MSIRWNKLKSAYMYLLISAKATFMKKVNVEMVWFLKICYKKNFHKKVSVDLVSLISFLFRYFRSNVISVTWYYNKATRQFLSIFFIRNKKKKWNCKNPLSSCLLLMEVNLRTYFAGIEHFPHLGVFSMVKESNRPKV